MTARKVWGIIFIILGVSSLLYGGAYYLEISNSINQINFMASMSRVPNEMISMMQTNIDNAYYEIGIYVLVGIYLAYTGTDMLEDKNTNDDVEQRYQEFLKNFGGKG